MLANDPIYIRPDEYLASELASPVRHEYRDGEVFAISGGTRTHSIITGNLFGNLWTHLRGSGGRAFSENMKVRVAAANSFYYPDVTVTCDERDRDRDGQPKQHYIEHPKLIVEVLSPSTAAFDRVEKFAGYRTLGSLEEFVLVSAERVEVEVFRRGESGAWTRQVYGADAGKLVRLDCVGLEVALGEVYEDTSLAIG